MARKRTCAQALPLSSCNFTTSCQSGQLNNPDQPMIQCTSCNKWFHFKCVCLDFTHDLKDTDFIVKIVQHNCKLCLNSNKLMYGCRMKNT